MLGYSATLFWYSATNLQAGAELCAPSGTRATQLVTRHDGHLRASADAHREGGTAEVLAMMRSEKPALDTKMMA
jgi:hypothetical protein